MKKSTQTICIALFAGILAVLSIGAFIFILASDEPTIKEQISQAEQDKLDRQEQFKDLLELKKETLPTVSPTITTMPELPEPPDLSLSGSDDHIFVDTAYEQIISLLKDQAEICALRVGDSIRPEGAAELSGDQCYVYSSDEEVVTVAENCIITAVAPGETYVLFGDGDNYLVYACIVTE